MGAYSPITIPNEAQLTSSGIDVNSTSTVTTGFYIGGSQKVLIMATLASGSFASAVLTLQCSVDGSTWISTLSTRTGAGFVGNIDIYIPCSMLQTL